MLRKKIEEKKAELARLNAQAEELEKREAELATAIEELTEESTEEERSVVESGVESLEGEQKENEESRNNLEQEIRELEEELDGEEAEQDVDPEPTPEEDEEAEERKGVNQMDVRERFFGMTPEQRNVFFSNENVRGYLGEVRSAMAEKRALTNVGLTIPQEFLGIIRENITEYSKLYKHVYVRQISGDGRAVIMGTIPEAVWTDCCANINELSLTFNDVEVGCWKVAGYYSVCNAVLEDSDVALATELITALGQAIGLALDKAILFGLGTRMPLGIFTRLAQTEQPTGYPETARPWVDLHTSNIKTIAAATTGVDLFAEIAIDSGAAKGKYARGEKVWVMNETTYTQLMASAMSVDAAGAIVTGVKGSMPAIGGIIEVLDFVPNDVIIGGYFDLYLLAERAGAKFASSEHVRFLADQTVFKGTARYDGQPAIAEGFVAIGINGTTPSASGVTFAPDDANTTNASDDSNTSDGEGA